MDPELLFVYGTLRRGSGHRMHGVLAALDRYEGCDPRDPEAPYVRRVARITLASGGKLRRGSISTTGARRP